MQTAQIESPLPSTSGELSATAQRQAAARVLLQEWLADESGYDEETWPELKHALEENRAASPRSLFSD